MPPKLFPFRLDWDETGGLFLVLTGLVYLLPFFLNGFFDRYLFPAVPFLMAGLLAKTPAAISGPNAAAPATASGRFPFSAMSDGHTVIGRIYYL